MVQHTYLLVVAKEHGRPHYEAYPTFSAAHEAAEGWVIGASGLDRIEILTIVGGAIDGVERLA